MPYRRTQTHRSIWRNGSFVHYCDAEFVPVLFHFSSLLRGNLLFGHTYNNRLEPVFSKFLQSKWKRVSLKRGVERGGKLLIQVTQALMNRGSRERSMHTHSRQMPCQHNMVYTQTKHTCTLHTHKEWSKSMQKYTFEKETNIAELCDCNYGGGFLMKTHRHTAKHMAT